MGDGSRNDTYIQVSIHAQSLSRTSPCQLQQHDMSFTDMDCGNTAGFHSSTGFVQMGTGSRQQHGLCSGTQSTGSARIRHQAGKGLAALGHPLKLSPGLHLTCLSIHELHPRLRISERLLHCTQSRIPVT